MSSPHCCNNGQRSAYPSSTRSTTNNGVMLLILPPYLTPYRHRRESMSSPTRFIQITNDNPLVKYESQNSQMSWLIISKTNPMFRIGNMGAPVSSFLRSGANGIMSFTFEGLEIMVMTSSSGSSNVSAASNTVSCTVDGKLLTTNISQFPQNNWPVCSSGSLPDGEHTLTVNMTDESQIFFDYILFTPSPTSTMLNLINVSTRIEASDPSITFSPGGFALQNDTSVIPSVNSTSVSNMTVSFIGQQLTWYGAYSVPAPSKFLLGTYSIDGGTPTQFLLENTSNFSFLINQLFFQTEVLPQGPHQVTARYLSIGTTSLSFVVVQNFSNTSPSPISNNTTPLETTLEGSRNNRDVDTIIGIALGVGGFLLTVILLLLRRCKKRGLKGEKSEERSDISSNQERAMGTVLTAMPDLSNVYDSKQSGNNLLTQNRSTVLATETSTDSTEALFNHYAITPFHIPSLPVSDFEEEDELLTHDNLRPLPLAVRDSHFPNDAANLYLNQHIRPVPNPFVPAPPIADSESARAADDMLETSTAPFTRLGSTTVHEERHADSGVRLGREILLFDETTSEWSLQSKDRLPPLYTHD